MRGLRLAKNLKFALMGYHPSYPRRIGDANRHRGDADAFRL
jgi:hypothetical protein